LEFEEDVIVVELDLSRSDKDVKSWSLERKKEEFEKERSGKGLTYFGKEKRSDGRESERKSNLLICPKDEENLECLQKAASFHKAALLFFSQGGGDCKIRKRNETSQDRFVSEKIDIQHLKV
jgi:hypothetical protein